MQLLLINLKDWQKPILKKILKQQNVKPEDFQSFCKERAVKHEIIKDITTIIPYNIDIKPKISDYLKNELSVSEGILIILIL